MHRLLFRYHLLGIAVSAAHRMAYAGLVLLGVALLGVTVVVFEVVHGSYAGDAGGWRRTGEFSRRNATNRATASDSARQPHPSTGPLATGQ